MDTFKINDRKFKSLLLPEGYYDVELYCHKQVWYKHPTLSKVIGDSVVPITIDLGDKGWQWVGLASEIVKDEAKCKYLCGDNFRIASYNSPGCDFPEYELIPYIEQFHSLLQREKMWLENPYGSIHPSQWDYTVENMHEETNNIKLYEEAQSLVGERLLLEKIR